MKKIKEMQAEHIYLITGASVANSAFFEQEDDCKMFLELADHYLGQYLKITRFQNNRDGWAMIITTKTADAIMRAYKIRRSLSKKCKKEFELKEVWRVLSDQIRIFLSTYVKRTNGATGRIGAKVRHRYERFVFESDAEALETQANLEEAYYPLEQPEERYRPRAEQSTLTKKMIRTSIYMGCAMLKVAENVKKLGMRCLDLGGLGREGLNDGARQLIQSTLQHHFQP